MAQQGEPRRSIPTRPADTEVTRQLRARTARRLFVVALALFLALGALDVYGVRTTERSASGGGYELTVEYATVSRPGLATPWSFEVRRAGGFPQGLTVAALSSYFDAYDENGFGPTPEEETSDQERTIWRFPPSSAETYAVGLDARIEPGVQLTRVKGRVDVLAGPAGPPVVSVSFSTLIMP